MFLPKNEKVLALALNAWRNAASLRANRSRIPMANNGTTLLPTKKETQ